MHLTAFALPMGLQIFLVHSAPYLALSALVLTLLCASLLISLGRRLDKLTLGSGGSLEESVSALTAHMKDTNVFRKELEQYLKHVESRIRTSIRGVGTIRYNPFANDGSSGGNQSFAIAFLDERLDGVVFSALYSRDRVGVYAKPIAAGVSTFTLSEEEEQAVAEAKLFLEEKKT